jgi:hypothetical protein
MGKFGEQGNFSGRINIRHHDDPFALGPQNTPIGPDPIIRLTVTLRTAIEVADARAVPDAKAQETALRSSYDMAANQSAAMSETFKAECRLGSLQVMPPVTPILPGTSQNSCPPAPALNATATYELKPKSAASPQ